MANNKIQTAVQNNKPEVKARQSVSVMLNSLLDGEKMRKRFDELLGKRTPQFLSSLVSMINDNKDLQEAFYQSPMSVIKSALQAATYDLPIDPALAKECDTGVIELFNEDWMNPVMDRIESLGE